MLQHMFSIPIFLHGLWKKISPLKIIGKFCFGLWQLCQESHKIKSKLHQNRSEKIREKVMVFLALNQESRVYFWEFEGKVKTLLNSLFPLKSFKIALILNIKLFLKSIIWLFLLCYKSINQPFFASHVKQTSSTEYCETCFVSQVTWY